MFTTSTKFTGNVKSVLRKGLKVPGKRTLIPCAASGNSRTSQAATVLLVSGTKDFASFARIFFSDIESVRLPKTSNENLLQHCKKAEIKPSKMLYRQIIKKKTFLMSALNCNRTTRHQGTNAESKSEQNVCENKPCDHFILRIL